MVAIMTALQRWNPVQNSGRRKSGRGLWYWVIVFPIKWCMILVFGMMLLLIALSVGMIAAIPWIIVRSMQHKSLKPGFLKKSTNKVNQ